MRVKLKTFWCNVKKKKIKGEEIIVSPLRASATPSKSAVSISGLVSGSLTISLSSCGEDKCGDLELQRFVGWLGWLESLNLIAVKKKTLCKHCRVLEKHTQRNAND